MHDSLLSLYSTTADCPHRRTPSHVGFALLLLLVAALWHAPARAFCDSFHPVPEFYVGDTNPASPTYDPACTHNDIQSAITAATCSYGTKIFITHEQLYTNQSLSVVDKNVSLIGRANADVCGPASVVICNPVCAPPPTGPLAVINGANGASVITISGTSHVTIQYLEIASPGKNADGNGGGIDFDGSGSLTIDTSWVANNHATNGGGIYFSGSGATTSTLTIKAHSEILNNTADDDGGGIFVQGNAALNVLEIDTEIDSNHAPNGHGGGVMVFGPAQANIGSPDFNGLPVISNNDAQYGGGIAAISGNDAGEEVDVRLFTTDSMQPVSVVNNTATHTGGGIYLKPRSQALPDVFNRANLYAWDYRIEDNVAVEGAAIYADVDTSINQSTAGEVWLGNTLVIGGDFPTSLGAVACKNPAVCNTINHNETTDPASGSIILIQDDGYFVANGFSMRGNHADHVIRIVGDNVRNDLFNCLIAENTTQHELIYESGSNAGITLNSCTLANDAIGASHVIRTESDLTLTDSIIDEDGTLTADYSGVPANFLVNYVLSNDITTLPDTGSGLILGEPTFVDLAGGDYHLKPTSLGIDFAPTTSAYYVNNTTDLEGKPRNIDLPSVGDVFGHQDLGAYELQNGFHECGAKQPDEIYCDGFNY